MAEYRRFISYIYAYEGDMKTKNVGFAKIEARNGQCRISISIKGAYECSGRNLTLYGYGYQGADCLLVPLGQVPVKNGTGEAVFGKQEENLGGSGYGLGFMKGLYLRSVSSGRKAYLTTWDDTVIHITNLRKARIAGEEGALRVASLTETEEIRKPDTRDEEPVRTLNSGSENLEAAGEAEAMEEALKGKTAEWAHQAPKPVKAEFMKPEFTKPEFMKPVVPQMDASGPEFLELEAAKQKTASKTAVEIISPVLAPPDPKEEWKPDADASLEAALSSEASMSTGETLKDTVWKKEAPLSGEEIPQNGTAGRMPEEFYFREGFTELPLWECLRKILPRKRALAEEGWEVLQIHIQDIGRLPRENWPYGNNSFVLHGYFQYQYLILARRQKQPVKRFQSGYQYILGVPGIFKPQEKFMASMFGLPEFKRAAGNREGDFGFWCGAVQM